MIELAKEKAKELFATYRFSLSIPNAPLGDLKDSIAKQCALIAVDIIKQAIDWHAYEFPNEEYDYWEQVEQEIQNL